ncbi:Holliday junction branch migration protein RuvA [Acholeplasma sp. OttesenSCG-928-E16]|nr:Holliday junction branch migration protein RuvA [Acholeplasma sp. OttesenSCG-928-E16]
MYSYIKGVVKEVNPTNIVIENNEIGYLIITPNPYNYKLDDKVIIFLYHYVREDIFNLYGFPSTESRDLFIKLISVSGIGPKSALSILASGKTNDVVEAIESGDAKYLTRYPGIGLKSAQQIILDLKGKLTIEDSLIPDQSSDCVDALMALGYGRTEIKKALKKVNHDLKVEDMIKQALQILIG